jgi:hypothetical protein
LFALLSRRVRRAGLAIVLLAAAPAALVTLGAGPAAAVDVDTEAEFRAAFGSATETTINLLANIDLTGGAGCGSASPATRPLAAVPLVINGNGFRIRQTCPETNVLFTQGVSLTINNATLDSGNNAVNGQGAAHSLTLNSTDITNVTSASSSATAIFNLGPVTLNSSTISGTSSDAAHGSAIGATGSVTLDNSTIAQTSGTTGATGIGAFGGPLLPITLTNSSIIDTTTSGGGAQGLQSNAGVPVNLTTSQVVGTSSPGNTSGIITINGGKTTLTDSSVLDTSGETTNGITGTGDVELNRSTIARATGEKDTAAIVMLDGDTLLVNSTLSNNTGGIATFQGGSVTMVYSDVVSNGGVEGSPDPAQMVITGDLHSFGSVVALAVGAGVVNCQASSTLSSGYNWADDDTCDFTESTDTQDIGGNPQLGALGANGGPTETRLPLTGSPLIDGIPTADCGDGDGLAGFEVTTDQRGISRPQLSGCDIGSVEVAPVPPGPGPGPGPEPAGPAGPAAPAGPVTAVPRFTG